MTMEKQPFEDVSHIKHGDFPVPCGFTGAYAFDFFLKQSPDWNNDGVNVEG